MCNLVAKGCASGLVPFLLILSLSGCVTKDCTRGGSVDGLFTLPLESDSDIEAYIDQTLDACEPKLRRFACIANRDAQIGRTISIVGLVAGTIVVPTLTSAAAANSAWIAASGAVAGGANELSKSFSVGGFSGTAAADTRREFVKSLEEAVAKALDPEQTPEARRQAARMAAVRCKLIDVVAGGRSEPKS